MDQFRQHVVRKKYLAVVQARLKDSQRVVKGYIKPKQKPPKYAVTKFKVLRRFKKFSILDVEPKTGRTNQIRIHLVQIGHPIIGERKYTVAKKWPLRFKRLCLHAYFLELRHPESRDLLRITSDIPSDINDFLGGLGVELRLKKVS